MEGPPLSFEGIIGHENVKKGILNSLASGKLSHAHLIAGEEGIGKSLIAKELALAILGKTINKQYVDIIQWKADNGKKSLGIESIIDLIEEINKKPYEGDKKVIIIYKANTMTVQAQNAFLKTIEEPPAGVYIILLTESLEDILDTIKSRCQNHSLRRLNHNDIRQYLRLKHPMLTEEEIINLISFSDGIPGRAEKLIGDGEFVEVRNMLLKILTSVKNELLPEIMENEEFLLKYKDNWKELLINILSFVRDTLVYKETGNIDLIINRDKYVEIKELSMHYSFNALKNIVKIVTDTGDNLKSNVNTALVFESMLLKIREAV